MKKLLLMIAMVASFIIPVSIFAETSSDVLMWYINLNDSPAPEIQESTPTFDTLNFFLRSTDDGSTINLNQHTYLDPADIGTGSGSGTIDGIHGTAAGVYHTDLSGVGDINWATYEFMMTLYSGGTLVAWSQPLFDGSAEPVKLSDLSAEAALYSRSGGDLNPQSIPAGTTPYNFGGHVVPEPTGGMLIFVGGALLALRRKCKCA